MAFIVKGVYPTGEEVWLCETPRGWFWADRPRATEFQSIIDASERVRFLAQEWDRGFEAYEYIPL